MVFPGKKKEAAGFSLLETVIGTALMLIVFVSIFGVFNMAVKLVGKAKAKAGAVALGQERMEMVRNLPYDKVGTINGMVSGGIPQTETIILNGIEYTRKNFVNYVDDPKDGTGLASEGGDDENDVTSDYKVFKTELSWRGAGGPIVFVTNIVPKGIETDIGGGTLKINVFDASVSPVASAKVRIENTLTNPPILTEVLTNNDGRIVFQSAATSSGYQITVTKDGYSTAKTYAAEAPNVNPNPEHLAIFEGETTEASFVIDKISSNTVRTWEPVKEFSWSDSFADWLKVSDYASTTASSGSAALEEEKPGSYWPSGYLMSQDIGPIDYMVNWKEFSWNDVTGASTTAKYKIVYYQNPDWVDVPDSDLPGNAAGFEVSPVDLSGLSTTTYPSLRLRADLSTEDASSTPFVSDWKLSWNAGPTPLPNLAFHMRGEKTIGRDSGDDPIYKYDADLSTGADGTLAIGGLEFDIYAISVASTTGYDVSESCPFQPINVSPGTASTTDLTLVPHAANTLLVSARDDSGAAVSGASARLYKIGYDETKTTSSCGQSFFSPLPSGNYTLEFSKEGYETASSTVGVGGQSSLELIMNKL